ncbi:Ribonuclease R [Burkholderiaceae bacterium]|nr:Ribonuclease R [Burkholderiaceae bacterium]
MSSRSTPVGHEDLAAIARDAMIERGLLPEFSPAVLAETRTLDASPARRDAPAGSARDLTHLPWSSIDNDDSRDLDQLTVAEALAGDVVRLLVAIADVDGLVKAGSATDGHAAANTTSVYTAARIFPMLPERLSTDLTSLNEEQERLAMVIDMTIAADGSVVESEVYGAWVRSRAKLTYNGVAAWLDGLAPAPDKLAAVPGLDDQLRLQDRIAQALLRQRRQRGALGLATPQARPVFDKGVLIDLQPDEKNRAKELIADFMIAANGATARFLESKRFPSLRRQLHAPRRWERIVQLAAGLGERLPDEPSAPALEAFLAKQRQADPGGFGDTSLAVVKLLGSGEYMVAPAGEPGGMHFGLAVSDYTHSTAPNRRYPDLITQRLVKAALAGEAAPYGEDELAALARHCTAQEDNAAKVERQVRKAAAAVLLRPRIGERFRAVVTGASDKGTWVRIGTPTAEGRVVQGFEGLDVGDKPEVELVAVDVARGFIDFRRAR